jgi:hypothetical protein
MSRKKSHHFLGLKHYQDRLMDLAEGKPVFSGRGQKPSSKDVVAAIASIKKCKKGSFFGASAACSCGWHLKAAARKTARQAQSSLSSVSGTS